MSALVEQLRALYRPTTVIPHADLHDLADGIQAQLVALSDDPTPERCETVAANLEGARKAVLKPREIVMAEMPE